MPPYCGVPSLFHQFPLAVVVVAVVAVVVACVVVIVLVVVVVVVGVGVVLVVVVGAVELVLHAASSMAATSNKQKDNQITLLFTLSSSLINLNHLLTILFLLTHIVNRTHTDAGRC